MHVVSDIHRRSGGWSWFFVWALFGSSWALVLVSLGLLLLIPTALLGVLLWRCRPVARRSAFGLLTGAGVFLVFIAWLQRDGPGTTCRHIPPAGVQCDQHLNPLPWLLIGILLVAAGVIAHARRV
jgi:hypothetical protein